MKQMLQSQQVIVNIFVNKQTGLNVKLEDVRAYFKTNKEFMRVTGLSHANYFNWKVRGYIPLRSQYLIQHVTDGALKVDFESSKKPK